MLHLTLLRSNGFSPVLRPAALHGVPRLLKTKEEVKKAAWKHFVAVNDAIRLLTLQFFCQLHALLGKNSLYALKQ